MSTVTLIYLTHKAIANMNNRYFKQPNYEIDVVEYFEETKQPFSVAEILSLQLGLGVNPNAKNFTGPVLVSQQAAQDPSFAHCLHTNQSLTSMSLQVISGEFDFFACAGDCPANLEAGITPLFTGAKSLEIAIHPDSGHSINYNKNATGAFGVITNFLKNNDF